MLVVFARFELKASYEPERRDFNVMYLSAAQRLGVAMVAIVVVWAVIGLAIVSLNAEEASLRLAS